MANHPNYLIRRHLPTACGKFPEGGLGDGRLGDSNLAQLWGTPQDLGVLYEAWPQIHFTVQVSHFVAAARSSLGDLSVGSFADTPLHKRLGQNTPFARPKIEARAPDPKTAAEVHRCSVNTAVFLAAFSSPVLGDVPVGRPFPPGRPRAKPASLVRRIADFTMTWAAYRRLGVPVRLACAGPRSLMAEPVDLLARGVVKAEGECQGGVVGGTP